MFFPSLFVKVLLKRYAYASRPSSTLLLVLPYSLSSLLVPINYNSLGNPSTLRGTNKCPFSYGRRGSSLPRIYPRRRPRA
jgi:hypothetical protein